MDFINNNQPQSYQFQTFDVRPSPDVKQSPVVIGAGQGGVIKWLVLSLTLTLSLIYNIGCGSKKERCSETTSLITVAQLVEDEENNDDREDQDN